MAAMALVNMHLFPCAICLETSDDPTRKDGPLQGGTGSLRNQNSQVDMFGDFLGVKYDDCNKKNYWIEANQLPKTSKMILFNSCFKRPAGEKKTAQNSQHNLTSIF